MAATPMGQIGIWALYSVSAAAAAGATTELVAAQTGRIRVVGLAVSADVAGTFTLKSASTSRGGFDIAATGKVILPFMPADAIPYGGWADTVKGEALNVTTVTCALKGVLVYAVELLS